MFKRIYKICFFTFILLCLQEVYALPCPNGKGILYRGDTPETVLKQCGEPTEKQTTTRILSSVNQWIFYRRHPYDPWNSQITVVITNDRVSKIQVIDQYPQYYCRQSAVAVGQLITYQTSCGNWVYYPANTYLCGQIFGIGSTSQQVQAACGKPANETVLEKQVSEETVFRYGGSRPQTIIFQNNKLTDWK